MTYDQIVLCLEQKQVILTRILDLTKQIEVRCRQPEIRMGELLDDRNRLLERMNKCNDLISRLIEQQPERERLRILIAGKEGLDGKTEQERRIEQLAAECRSLVRRASLLDQSARELLQNRMNEVKQKIRDLQVKDGNLFRR